MNDKYAIEVRDRRRKEVFMIDDEYLNGYARLCGQTATAIYLSLCRHANKDQQAWPSFKLLRAEHGIGSNHTIMKALQKLEEWGIVAVEKAKDEITQRQKPNVYTLVDKSCWKPKPGAKTAHGAECSSEGGPSALFDESRVHLVHCKDTHIEGYPLKGGCAEAPTAQSPKEKAIAFFGSQGAREDEILWFMDNHSMPREIVEREVGRFVDYWTERTLSGKRVRWELEPTFEIRRRLATWFSRAAKDYMARTGNQQSWRVAT